MIYECLIDKRHRKFLVAKSQITAQLDEPWSPTEHEWPFEIGLSEDVDIGIFDRSVRIQWSGGVLEVMASDISASIVREQNMRMQLHIQEMSRRQYPMNMRTIYQPLDITAKQIGDT